MALKRSFFDRLTGAVRLDDKHLAADAAPSHHAIPSLDDEESPRHLSPRHPHDAKNIPREPEPEATSLQDWNEEGEGQLTVDVYNTPESIVVKTMVAGVRPEDLDISITRDMISIHGKREEERVVKREDYFVQELYWGSFSRTISLPEEVDVEEAEAIERHGLLIIKMPKLDKKRETKLKVRSNS
jgi:HSP20 family protein